MFESLTEKLNRTFKNLRGYGKLSEKNIQDALREVRMALLEADVHFKVVRQFIESIQQRALGQEVMDSLTPAQQVIKIVHDELVALMGGQAGHLNLSGRPPATIMLMERPPPRASWHGTLYNKEGIQYWCPPIFTALRPSINWQRLPHNWVCRRISQRERKVQ